jgi:hypothetical protein
MSVESVRRMRVSTPKFTPLRACAGGRVGNGDRHVQGQEDGREREVGGRGGGGGVVECVRMCVRVRVCVRDSVYSPSSCTVFPTNHDRG